MVVEKDKKVILSPIHPPHKNNNQYRIVLSNHIRLIEKDLFDKIQKEKPKSKLELQKIINTVFAAYLLDKTFANNSATTFVNGLESYHNMKFFASIKRIIKVNIKNSLNNISFNHVLRDNIKDNVDLINDIPVKLKEELSNVINKSFNELGVDQEKIQKYLEKNLTEDLRGRFKVARTRAKVIARDQTSKTIANMTEYRHRQLGITDYNWLGVDDSRERVTHLANNGLEFSYDKPSEITGNPGHDVMCRCVAVAKVSISKLLGLIGGGDNVKKTA